MDILLTIINGGYSDWFFNNVVANFGKFIINNFAVLWMLAAVLKKLSTLTTNTLDDSISDRFIKFLTNFKGVPNVQKQSK